MNSNLIECSMNCLNPIYSQCECWTSLPWGGQVYCLTSLASDPNSALRGSCACTFVAGNLSKYRRGRNLNPGGAMQWLMTRTRRTSACPTSLKSSINPAWSEMFENSLPCSAYIFAIRVISTTICACRISWLVTRVYYLCLEPSVFRLLNKYFGFSGRAEKKKKKKPV